MVGGAGSFAPRLKPWYRLSICDAGMLARFGESALLFEGDAARDVLPQLLLLLDGTHSVDELSDRLGPGTRTTIEHVLSLLEGHGLLLEDALPERDTDRLLAATAYRPRALAAASASVLGHGALAQQIAGILTESGVAVTTDWDADLVVAAPSCDRPSELDGWNREALERGTALLALTPFDGTIATVGPLVVGGETACVTCLQLRRHGDPYAGSEQAVRATHLSAPALDTVLAGLAAAVAVSWLATGDSAALNGILALGWPELALTRHSLYRVPRCPSCSESTASAALVPWGTAGAIAT